jgi:hypothetical protein
LIFQFLQHADIVYFFFLLSFGQLRLQGHFAITRDLDAKNWQENIDCFLFDRVLVMTVVKDAKIRALKASVILRHVRSVESLGGKFYWKMKHSEKVETLF